MKMMNELSKYEKDFYSIFPAEIELIEELVRDSITIVKNSVNFDDRTGDPIITVDTLYKYLSANVIEAIRRAPIGALRVVFQRLVATKNICVNVYGTPKYGEVVFDSADIKRDMDKYIIKVGEDPVDDSKETYDIDKMIAILHVPRDISHDDSKLIVDIDAAFLRFMSKYMSNQSNPIGFLKESIMSCIISKWIAYLINYMVVVQQMKNKFDTNHPIYDDDRYFMVYMLYKLRWAYSVANNLDGDETYGVAYLDFDDFVKNDVVNSSATSSISNLINIATSRIRGTEYLMPRYIDRMIMNAKNELTNYGLSNGLKIAMNGAVRMARNPAKRYFYEDFDDDYKMSIVTAYESFFPKELKAIDTMIGIESVTPKSQNFRDYRKLDRAKILARLNSTERRRYLDVENDYMKLRAEVMNAHDQDSQRILMNRCAALGNIIRLEMDRTANDQLLELLSLLESDRYNMQEALSSRDFFKERNSRLYGQLKTANRWDF